jgi:hypothetical protein
LSADEVALVPAAVFAVMSTAPAVPDGDVATHVVTEEQLTEVAAAAPKLTEVAPGTKPVPVMVTAVPPVSGPPAGETPVMDSALVVVAEGPPLFNTVCPVKVWLVDVPAESVTVNVA